MTKLANMTADELRLLLASGLVEPVGATEDARVVSYKLTSAGRILLGNQLGKERAR